MENNRPTNGDRERDGSSRTNHGLIIVAFAAVIFLSCIFSPPHLFDDVDAVQAQIARNMLDSGDWVTARLDGVAYLEKPPLIYWMMASSYAVFGVHDWSARLPVVLSVMLLCWVTYRFGKWVLGETEGFYAGLVLTTSIGLFLFTRILIPDAALTLCITLSIWAWFRMLEDESPGRRWPAQLGVGLGVGLLFKGLIAILFPCATMCLYMLVTRQFFQWRGWTRIHLGIVAAVSLLIAAPWHILATLRNPPYFEFTMRSVSGEYHGFFWFYFINEHLLRFLDRRYPRDYNTVPLIWFWLLNLVWIFPWSLYLPAVLKQGFRPIDLASRARLLAVCWIVVVMGFFSFSTTQEYYSMPIYPAMALLVGSAMAAKQNVVVICNRVVFVLLAIVMTVMCAVLFLTRGVPAEGNIAQALSQHPDLYTLSLGHMGDLTLQSFAYLRLPLVLALIAVLLGVVVAFVWRSRNSTPVVGLALMMMLFFVAARVAMVTFDPYLGSYPLAAALEKNPPGRLIAADAYYGFSSVHFYSNRPVLILNGRNNNLEYGSYAPSAPDVFVDDEKFLNAWHSADRYYLLVHGSDLERIKKIACALPVVEVKKNTDDYLMTNHPL